MVQPAAPFRPGRDWWPSAAMFPSVPAWIHLAMPVRDQERSRPFYETYFGFGARPARRYDDGVLMLYDAKGFALALVQPRSRSCAPLDALRRRPADRDAVIRSQPLRRRRCRARRRVGRAGLRQRQVPRPGRLHHRGVVGAACLTGEERCRERDRPDPGRGGEVPPQAAGAGLRPPIAITSSPPGPAANARIASGATRTTSHGRRSRRSSSMSIWPEPPTNRFHVREARHACLLMRWSMLTTVRRPMPVVVRELLDGVGEARAAARAPHARPGGLGGGAHRQRLAHGRAQALGGQLLDAQLHAGAGLDDPPRDLGLVAAERHGGDRDARGDRLLHDAHAAVADDRGGALEHGRMRDEALDAHVGRRRQLGAVVGVGERQEARARARRAAPRSRARELLVALVLGRARHEHPRVAGLVEPGRAPRRAGPRAGRRRSAPSRAGRCAGTRAARP